MKRQIAKRIADLIRELDEKNKLEFCLFFVYVNGYIQSVCDFGVLNESDMERVLKILKRREERLEGIKI